MSKENPCMQISNYTNLIDKFRKQLHTLVLRIKFNSNTSRFKNSERPDLMNEFTFTSRA